MVADVDILHALAERLVRKREGSNAAEDELSSRPIAATEAELVGKRQPLIIEAFAIFHGNDPRLPEMRGRIFADEAAAWAYAAALLVQPRRVTIIVEPQE